MSSAKLENVKGNIFICGFMASGKSTLGKNLSEQIDWPYCDLDDVIEEREGKTIRDIFAEYGESYFREKEREYLAELSKNFHGVISLGGGALQNQQIVDQVKQHGLLLFVDTPLEQITQRVLSNTERPILFDDKGKIKSKETLFTELKTLYLGRKKYYKQAQVSIQTPLFPSVQEMTDAAIEKIKRHV